MYFGLAAEDQPNPLHQHERDAPGRQQRVERPLVEIADQPAFEHKADGADDDEGSRNAEQEGQAEIGSAACRSYRRRA